MSGKKEKEDLGLLKKKKKENKILMCTLTTGLNKDLNRSIMLESEACISLLQHP